MELLAVQNGERSVCVLGGAATDRAAYVLKASDNPIG